MPDQPADGKQHTPPSSSAELGVAASDETWGSPVGYEPQTYERTQPAYISDRRFYRIVVGFLGAVAVSGAAGARARWPSANPPPKCWPRWAGRRGRERALPLTDRRGVARVNLNPRRNRAHDG